MFALTRSNLLRQLADLNEIIRQLSKIINAPKKERFAKASKFGLGLFRTVYILRRQKGVKNAVKKLCCG